MSPLSALTCLWDNPDRCPQVRVDGVTGRRYCRMCGSDDEPRDEPVGSAQPETPGD